MAEKSRERENVGHVDHVAFAYKNVENLNKARQRLAELFDIDDWFDLGEVEDIGIHPWISRKAGLELLCPVREKSFISDQIEKQGEGFWGVVMGVADIDKARKKAEGLGYKMPPEFVMPKTAAEIFNISREQIIGDPLGIGVSFGSTVIIGEFQDKKLTKPSK